MYGQIVREQAEWSVAIYQIGIKEAMDSVSDIGAFKGVSVR